MAVSVVHSTVATLPDEPGAEINKTEWNAPHAVTGLGTFADQDFATPPAIGGTTPAAGAFTTLSASSTVSGAGFSTYLASPPAIGGTVAAAIAGTAITATTVAVGSGSTTGYLFSTNSCIQATADERYDFRRGTSGSIRVRIGGGANSADITFGGTSGGASTRYELHKSVTAIADATGTATFTVTIPNAAHSAMLKVTLVGSLGAGGAIGANEATATVSYDIAICRTTGVNAVATISAAYGAAASAVAGAATVTVTAALSAIAGAVGASNTFTVNVTITKSGGASANHTCLCYGRLLNANATGVTIA